MDGQSLLIQALVYLAAGVVSVAVANRVGLGSVLGYLIAGALIGPFALNLVGETGDVMRVAEFGVVILLFLIGLEVRPALLWRMKTAIFGLGALQMALTAALIGAAALALGLGWRPALAVGLVLALSSTAIVLQLLEERNLRSGAVGEASFGVLLFQDLAVIPLFALLPLLGVAAPAAHAAAEDHGMSVVAGLPPTLQTLAMLGAVIVVLGGGRYLIRPVFRFIAAANLREIFTAAALLLVIAVATLMQLVGLSPALGAFLAGVVLAESEFRRELESDIEPFRGLLLGLFFITVGAGLNFDLVISRPGELALIVVGLLALKGVAIFGAAKLFGLPSRDAATTAVFLAQGGEFAFVLLGFTVAGGVLPAALASELTAAIAISMALTPLLVAAHTRLLLSRVVALEAPPPEAFPSTEPQAIVAGFGRFGQIAARLLTLNGFNVTTMDSSVEQIDLLRKFGRKVYYGDASRLDLLRAAGADKARLLVVAIDDPEKSVQIVETARQAFPDLIILARAWDRRHAYELVQAGAHEVERETFEGGLSMGRRALLRLGFSERRAARAASLFRDQDLALFERLAPAYAEGERFVLETRDQRETMDRLLSAEMARVG
ncbi:MAG: monovalent cation:proton antiporter-2 (CPA2) family protein, partial [Phenylobacterium sp.]